MSIERDSSAGPHGRSRREFLATCGAGFGALAAAYLMGREATGAPSKSYDPDNPFAPKPPHVPAKARSVISLFMHGGPSHLDTFDPKPLLRKLDGQPVPASFGMIQSEFTKIDKSRLLASRRSFSKCGESGIEVSDLFPHVSRHADELAVIRSCHHNGFTHGDGLNWLNTGWGDLGRPSVGSWVVYGLGTEAENLPAFVVMLDGATKAGPNIYGSGFLPATYQGTPLKSQGVPMLNASPPAGVDPREQRRMLDFLRVNNARHLERREDDSRLSARLASYELAFKMQISVPQLTDLSNETEATRKLYGLDDPETRNFGTKCLLGRRMVERGVRFVQLYSGGMGLGVEDWDGHSACDKNHLVNSRRVDKPIAGLIADLKVRGLLEETLVVWGGEFGRTPVADQLDGGKGGGRDHNPYGFTTWMAGGGVRGGQVIGATDEIGLRATQDTVHVHDLHATLLGLMGIDHEKLTYFFQGRDFRLTDVEGKNNLAARLTRGG